MENDVHARILHLSGECLVFNKKSGEAVEGAKPGVTDLPRLLANAIAAHDCPAAADVPGLLPLPVAAHRLDVPVSGCVAFARTRSALGFLNAAFAETYTPAGTAAVNGVEKTYWAVVETPRGILPHEKHLSAEYGELVHWIQTDTRKNKSRAYTEPGPGRKKAILRYRLAGEGQNYLFLEIQLHSGRHHQIRAQLEQIGLHIKGDLKYGARRSEKNGGIRLHARSLSFPDPAGTGTRIAVCAPVPTQDNLWLAFQACVS